MSTKFQDSLENLVISNKISKEDIDSRFKIIQKIQEHESTGWSYGFCSGCSFEADEMVLSLIQLDDHALSHVGVCSVLLKNYISKIIDSHMPTLSSKKARMTYIDEYGDKNSKKWEAELRSYYKEKIIDILKSAVIEAPENIFDEFSDNKVEFLFWTMLQKNFVDESIVRNIDFYISFCDSNQEASLPPRMTGVEYELYIANIINKETNWSAKITKASGDQGADLVLTKGPLTAVLQTKYYSSKVGNKAIQEAYSAKKFYNADLAFVVSNAEFTSSAWELAEKTSVKIISEGNLIDFLK